jgi:1-deoxy-D-xylulose-5-phosphate synthase
MGGLLEQVGGPDDIKGLTASQLKALAEEIRQFILDSVSRGGGHLASNLGVVELTLALHHVFDFKSDKLLWDVGHQCYAHKIITGRREQFARLRKADGISGFPDPAESIQDQFVVGHAGTAITTAIGMAMGQDQLGKDDMIVAVVGDAGLLSRGSTALAW